MISALNIKLLVFNALLTISVINYSIVAGTEERMKTYFGFALADSMFAGDCKIDRKVLSVEEVKDMVAKGVESCCNPSHLATINAMREKFGIDVMIPEKPPRVAIGSKESIIVMGVRGLPRLTDRHEYTVEEIEKAQFSFSVYTVI